MQPTTQDPTQELNTPARPRQAHIKEIPRGWRKLDPLGRIITDGIDEMEYEIGFGYVLI